MVSRAVGIARQCGYHLQVNGTALKTVEYHSYFLFWTVICTRLVGDKERAVGGFWYTISYNSGYGSRPIMRL